MDHEAFVKAAIRNRTLLESELAQAIAPKRNPDDPGANDHLAWMLNQCVGFHREGKLEKANRWLGFVQGVMYERGLATLEELKQANMPEGETFDPERV